MNIDDLGTVLSGIPGYTNYGDYAVNSAGNTLISCVLAPFTHASKEDRHPSMSVRADGSKSVVRCFGCGEVASTLGRTLMRRASRMTSAGHAYQDVEQVYSAANAAHLFDESAPDAGDGMLVAAGPIRTPLEITVDATHQLQELHREPWLPVHENFLASRGTSKELAGAFGCVPLCPGRTYEHLVDSRKGELVYLRHHGIMTPIYDLSGNMCLGASIRNFDPGADQSGVHHKVFTPWRCSTSYFMFGQQFARKVCGRPVVIVEGAFDVMHMWSLGIPALGANGTSFSRRRAELLRSLEPSGVIIAADPDDAGANLTRAALAQLPKVGLPVIALDLPRDPKHLSREEFLGLDVRLPRIFGTD